MESVLWSGQLKTKKSVGVDVARIRSGAAPAPAELLELLQAVLRHKDLKIQYFTQCKAELRLLRAQLSDLKE